MEKKAKDRILRVWLAVVMAMAALLAMSAIIAFGSAVRAVIIHIAEVHVVHRALTATVWHARFIKCGILGMKAAASIIVLLLVLRITPRCVRFAPSKEGARLFVLPMQRLRKDWKILVVIFCALLSLRVYYLHKKAWFHVDEGLSIIMSSYGRYGWGRDYDDGSTYTGKEVKQMMFCSELSPIYTARTIARLWRDNRDPAHTNFYYSLLRIFLTGMKNGSVKDIVHHAGALNLVLFAASFFLAYMLLVLLLADEQYRPIVFCTLAIMFLTAGSVSNTVLFRPYQLQECMTLLLALIIVRLARHVQTGDASLITVKNLVIVTLVSALFLLSAYASILLFAIAGLLLVGVSIKKKQYNMAVFLCFAAFYTAVCAFCLYPHYFRGFFVSRGGEAIERLESASFDKLILQPMSFYASQCVRYLFYPPVMLLTVITAVAAIWQRKKGGSASWLADGTQAGDAVSMDDTPVDEAIPSGRASERSEHKQTIDGSIRLRLLTNQGDVFVMLFLLAAAALWQAGIVFLLPFNDVRHLYAAFPLMCLVFALVALLCPPARLRRVPDRFAKLEADRPHCGGILRRVYLIATVAIYALALPLQGVLPQVPYKPQVQYLSMGERYECLADDKVPLVIVRTGCTWKDASFFMYLNDNQEVHFAAAPRSEGEVQGFIESMPYDDFWLLVLNNDDEEPMFNTSFDFGLFHCVGYWCERRITK